MASTIYPALVLTLRFPSDLPDLGLPAISNPAATTGLSLLPRIRNNLPTSEARSRIILIHSGRVIPLKESLAKSLRLPSSKSLGKARVEEANSTDNLIEQDDTVRWIIHAAFTASDESLTTEELIAEENEGRELNAKLIASTSIYAHTNGDLPTSSQNQQTPQGFDRLLAAGIPVDEIASLRTHFRTLLAAQRPSDAPLVPSEILVLEERWLDGAASPANEGNLLSSLGGAAADAGSSDQIDDVVLGNLLGFFWPLGGLLWLSRQHGIWREQRTSSVFVGFLINIGLCIIRRALLGGMAE